MKNQILEFNSGSIEKIEIFRDRFKIFQSNYAKSGVKLKTIENLMVNWGLKCINLKPWTKIKKTLKAKVAFEILTGIQLHKYKSLKPFRGAIRPITNWGTKLDFHLLQNISNFADVITLLRWLNSTDMLLQEATYRYT